MSNKTLLEYSKHIVPMFRTLSEFKEELKIFKEEDDKCLELIDQIKQLQDELTIYLEEQEESKLILNKIAAINTDINLAVKSAKNGTSLKAPQLKSYFAARAKEDAVDKAIEKGELFSTLNKELE